MFKYGGLLRVAQLVSHTSIEIAGIALRIVSLICTGPEESVEEIISCGVLKSLKLILNAPSHASLLRECCLTLANIMCGPEVHIQEVINNGIIIDLCGTVSKNSDFSVLTRKIN